MQLCAHQDEHLGHIGNLHNQGATVLTVQVNCNNNGSTERHQHMVPGLIQQQKISRTVTSSVLPGRLVEPCLYVKLPLLFEVLIRHHIIVAHHFGRFFRLQRTRTFRAV